MNRKNRGRAPWKEKGQVIQSDGREGERREVPARWRNGKSPEEPASEGGEGRQSPVGGREACGATPRGALLTAGRRKQHRGVEVGGFRWEDHPVRWPTCTRQEALQRWGLPIGRTSEGSLPAKEPVRRGEFPRALVSGEFQFPEEVYQCRW